MNGTLPRALARRLRRQTVTATVAVGVIAAAAALAIGAAGLLVRPEVIAAGPRFAGRFVLALAASSAPAALLVAPLAALFGLRRRWERHGAATGLALLGLSPRTALGACVPVVVAMVALAGVLNAIAEPVAWRALHGLKGSPALSAAVLGRLHGGEVVHLRTAGLTLTGDSPIAAHTSDGWTAEAEAIRPTTAGWEATGVRVVDAGMEWTARRVVLQPVTPSSPPTNPLTRGTIALLGASGAPQAQRVGHRRLAIPVLALLLALCGWGLGARSGGRAGLGLGGVALTAFVCLRAADSALLTGALGGPGAGWAPLIPPAAWVWILLREER